MTVTFPLPSKLSSDIWPFSRAMSERLSILIIPKWTPSLAFWFLDVFEPLLSFVFDVVNVCYIVCWMGGRASHMMVPLVVDSWWGSIHSAFKEVWGVLQQMNRSFGGGPDSFDRIQYHWLAWLCSSKHLLCHRRRMSWW